MPTKKYRVDTDKGSYEVEVEEPLGMGTLEMGRRSAAGEGPVTGNESKEPGTWGGGFLKSLKDQIVTPDLMKTMQRATDPHDLSSYTTALLAPLDATRSVSMGMYKGLKLAAKAAAAKTSGAGGVATFPFRMVKEFSDSLPSNITKQIGEFKGPTTSPVSAPPKPPVQSGGSDIVDRMLQTRRAAPTGPAPRLVKSTAPPQSLDDVLSGALEEAGSGHSLAEGRSTLPPEMRTAGEGTIRQSGKFPKSGQRGQAGGYSSGRPSITPDREQELHDAFMERMGMGQPNPSDETLGPGPHPEMAAERAVGQEPGVGGAQAPDSNPAAGSSPAGPSTDQPSAAIQLGSGSGQFENPDRMLESSPWLGDENWSSGVESGSPEALRARALHSYAGEMNQGPRVFQAPGIGDLLARILAEGRGK